jgi:hypothetical protein
VKFEKSKVWQRSCSLAADMYKLFSQSRDFGLKKIKLRTKLQKEHCLFLAIFLKGGNGKQKEKI